MAEENVNIRLTAQDEASASLKNVRNNIEQVGTTANRVAGQTRNVTGALGGVGRSAGQAGIQIQQFVGQLQGGVNPMVALSQQGADLGFVLGVPLVGAVVSIAAVIAGSLIPSLTEAKASMAELNEELTKIVGNFEDFNPQELAFAQKSLTDQIGEQRAVLIRNNTEREKQIRIIDQANAAIATGKSNILGEVSAIKSARDALIEIDARRLIELRRLKDLEEQQRKVNNLRNETQVTRISAPEIAEFKVPAKDPLEALKRQAEAVKAQVDPLKALQAERQNLQAMEANNLITTQEYEIRLAQVTKRYQEMVPAIAEATRANEQFRSGAIETITDGLTGLITGAKSAKDAFKDMARSIINDIIKIQIRRQVAGIVGNMVLPSFDGGGYTGMGGRSGGIDGKGGFPAILHPNETVVDHSKGQSVGGGDSPINVTLNISTGVAQTVRTEIQSMLPMITNATKAAIVDAKQRGGSFARAMA